MANEIQTVKRVTDNFKRLINFDGNALQSWQKWKEEMQNKGAVVAFDRRNNIYCVSPTMDYEMYYNYINYLNEDYNEWKNYGYLDMGLVPYMMWPSFMDNSPLREQFRKLARLAGINLIQVNAVSFLKEGYSSVGTDYWIFKDDLYKLMKFLEAADPMYRFNVDSPENATLSAFLKPLAEIQRSHRGN